MPFPRPAYGQYQPLQKVFPPPIALGRAPLTTDTRYALGQVWINTSNNQVYMLASVVAASATWSILGPGASDVDTITADSGGPLSPAGGNINILGGTNVTTAGAGSTVTINLDDPVTLTTINATTFDTNVAAAGLTMAGTTIAADGTDANIDINLTPKGTGAVEVTGDLNVTGDLGFTGTLTVTGALDVDNLELDGNTISSTNTDGDIILDPDGTGTTTISSGGLLVSGGDILNTHSDAGTDVTIEVTNSDNTNAASRAGFEVATGGTSSGDPYVNFLISGGQTFTMGIDNSTANDDFVISDAAALGTANRISIDGTSGDVTLPSSDLEVSRAGGAATPVQASVTNSDNTNADSPALLNVTSGGTSGGDAAVVASITGGQAFSLGVDNSTANDDFVLSDSATLGTNNRISVDGSSGDVSFPTSDVSVTRAGGAATPVQASVVNTDNTNADSPALLNVTSGGTSGGDAALVASISGGQAFSLGVDNSTTNDDFVISDSGTLGTNNRVSIDGSSGDISFTGNVRLPSAATQIQLEGGAATDFIGQGTLALGTVTIANTNIDAADRVFVQRTDLNSSSALGQLTVTVTPSTNFVVTAVDAADGSTTVTGDTSIFDYFIVRQL